jgi:hypothetical protein
MTTNKRNMSTSPVDLQQQRKKADETPTKTRI